MGGGGGQQVWYAVHSTLSGPCPIPGQNMKSIMTLRGACAHVQRGWTDTQKKRKRKRQTGSPDLVAVRVVVPRSLSVPEMVGVERVGLNEKLWGETVSAGVGADGVPEGLNVEVSVAVSDAVRGYVSLYVGVPVTVAERDVQGGLMQPTTTQRYNTKNITTNEHAGGGCTRSDRLYARQDTCSRHFIRVPCTTQRSVPF